MSDELVTISPQAPQEPTPAATDPITAFTGQVSGDLRQATRCAIDAWLLRPPPRRSPRASKKGVKTKAEVFHKPADFEAFLSIAAEAMVRVPMRVLACCLPPNHFHLVLWRTRTATSAAGCTS